MKPLDLLLERASCKAYLPDPLSDEEVRLILEAGQAAPSGRNRQPVALLAVTNPDIIHQLSQLNARVLGTDSDPFYHAPAVFAVLADPSVSTYLYDGSLAAGQMLLGANALGLGSCWIHRAREVFGLPEGKEILRQAGFPEDFEGIGFVIAGHPAADCPVKKKTSLTGVLK